MNLPTNPFSRRSAQQNPQATGFLNAHNQDPTSQWTPTEGESPLPGPETPRKPAIRRFAPVIASVVTFLLGLAIGASPSNANQAAPVPSPSPVPTVTVTAKPSATPTVTTTVTATPAPAPTVTVTEAAQPEPAQEDEVLQGSVEEPAAPAEPEPEPASAYYANCSAARAAGVTPIYVGEPGYRSGLDRDGDGVACE